MWWSVAEVAGELGESESVSAFNQVAELTQR